MTLPGTYNFTWADLPLATITPTRTALDATASC
jgi:hypothetical protein